MKRPLPNLHIQMVCLSSKITTRAVNRAYQSGKSGTIRESNQASGVRKACYA